ncbi:hypothetical protein [Actinomycetospora sp. CA-053990]|uniref:hypothetical protein n=1 Tax=Actinomycetospora sp. CA-053990 TaxID=3239891 RepID=UPI003D906A59
MQVFIDDERLLAHSFQLYPDSAAIAEHWRLSDPSIAEVMEHCSVERGTFRAASYRGSSGFVRS